MVLDPRTGKVKKGTKSELFAQALKPQVVYKAAELEPVGKGAEAKLLRQQTERLRKRPVGFAAGMSPEQAKAFSKGLIEQEKRAKKLQEEFERNPQYKEVESAGYIVESPLAYGFGMLNTGSAAMAPLIKGVQDLISPITPGVKTRPERYKQAEEGGVLNQFLTNLATRQGMFDQFQAQLLPPEMEVDGVTALFLQEGSPLTTALGIATEFAAPITPLGIPAEIAKMAKVVGKYSPSLLKFAQAKQLDDVLKASDSKKTIEEIKTELKSEGKEITPVTLRGRAAESIADVYATERVLSNIKDPNITVGEVKRLTKNSPTVQGVLGVYKDSDPILKASTSIQGLKKSLIRKTAKGTDEIPMLRRAFDIGEDVADFVRTGKKPKFDADIIRRHVRSAAIRIDPDIAKEAKDLIKKSYREPLTDEELQTVADVLKDIKKYEYKNPEEVVYEATKGAVAEVLRDNFLKLIPDDMVAVGRSVVVPAKVIAKRAFRKNPKLMEYMKRRQEYMEHTSTATPTGRQYNLSKNAQRNIRALFDAQDSSVPFKIDNPLNVSQFNILQNKVAEDLAIELLGGIRLQQGSLTAEFARLKGAERGTLLSPVSGKVSSFGLSLKGLANSLRILQPKLVGFLGKPTVDMTPQMSRFMRELNDQSLRAWRQVEARLKKTSSDVDARDAEIENTLQQGLRVKLQGMETQALRAQPEIADVSSSVRSAVLDNRFAEIDKLREIQQQKLENVRQARQTATKRYKEIRQYLDQRLETDLENRMEVLELYQKFSRRYDSYIKKLNAREQNIRRTEAKRIEKIKERRQKKSETFSQRRKLQALSDQYGRATVENTLEAAGITNYNELVERLDDLQNNMQEYVEAVYRGEQWRILINKFFTNPGKEFATNPASPDFYINRLKERKLLDNTFLRNPNYDNILDAGDILPVTPENLKLVIDRIRESAPELKKFGLSSNPIFKNNEDYFLPILELMVDIQRTENMQQAVQRFIVEDPDLLIRVGQTYNSTAGLKAIKSIADNLEFNINLTLSLAKRKGLLKQTDVNLLIEQCKEVLFNSAMKDIWNATGRNGQIRFLQTYLDESIKQEELFSGVNWSLINAYNEGVLNSKTFADIRSKSETILRRLQNQLQRSDKITAETRPIIDEFVQKIPEVIVGMEKHYLLTLLGKTNGLGLFGDQVTELYSYMSRYGLSPEATLNNLNALMPKLDYIGSSNMALLYGGDMSGVYENIQKLFKTSTFQDRLKKLAMFGTTENKYAFSKILTSIESLLAGMGKLSIANMLYGVLQASARFMGFNRLTAPHIYLTTIGYGATKIQDVLKFTGVALGGGVPLALRNVIKGLTGKTFGSFVDSNRYLYLPDDDIVIRASDTNAMRDYTAGELRQIGVDTGFEYSRAAAEFYDDQYKGLLDAMRMTPQGKMEKKYQTFGRRFLENITGQTNFLADFAHLQDAELRRQVFIQALKNGETVEDAVSLAKQVLLDYTTLARWEKQKISRYVRFYAFMRTMNVATINNFYRGIIGKSTGAFVPRLLRAQNSLTKETSQDFVSMTDDQRGRLYNIYAGTIDDVDVYLSGPPNPQVQAFELVSMLPLFMLGAVTDNRIMSAEEVELESAIWSTIDQLTTATSTLAHSKVMEAIEATPIAEYFLKRYASGEGAYRRPFPKEFIYAAEQQGILDDVIKRYDLGPRRRTPGRPLTEEGEYLSFRKGSSGLKGYHAYLKDRLLGAYTMPAAWVGMYGKGGVQKDRIAVSTRAINEYWKMRMLEEGVQSPEFRAKYLKSATIQKDMGMFQNILGMAYQLGVVTPTSSRSKKFIVDSAMKQAQRIQQELGQSNEKQ